MKFQRIIAVFLLIGARGLYAQPIGAPVDWPSFLAAHDLVFHSPPLGWTQAPYFGNGFIGSMVYCDSTDRRNLIVQVFRTDVQDHRKDSAGWTAYSRPRLAIGFFSLRFKGTIAGCDLRLNLWNAALEGTITTSAGVVQLRHFTAASKDIIVTEGICKNGNEAFGLSWHPAEPVTTRKTLFPAAASVIPAFAAAYGDKYLHSLQVFQPNPPGVLKRREQTSYYVQDLLRGGQYVTAWRAFDQPGRQVFYATIQNSYPGKMATNAAEQLLASVRAGSVETIEASHRAWWHRYYPRSFMTIPDKELEGLYWLQLYKLGSSTRADGPVMDTPGPWLQTTPWPYITWDLNVQLCYWALNASNHLDIARSLPNRLNRYRDHLVQNVLPVEWQKDAAYLPLATAQDLLGNVDDDRRYVHLNANLPWAMHNVWLMYRFSMDRNFLRDRCYPLLLRSMNYYLHLLEKGSDGRLHIPLGYSPEYPGRSNALPGETRDANVDLGLLRWGLQTLIETAELLKTDPGKVPRWRETLAQLADYPVDETGFKVGADLPFSQSHRHYSHLLMIYPLYLVNREQPGQLPLIKRSLQTWIGDVTASKGYSFTGAASISASIGEGDEALNYLNGLNRFLLPNGLYTEAGPCLETPLSAAKALQDMLLQSWGGKLRIFPAVPAGWKDLEIRNWLGEGAFEVSARMREGRIDFLSVKSLAGAPCVINCHLPGTAVSVVNGRRVTLHAIAPDTYDVGLKKGETVTIRASGSAGR